jgi:hypothetical protein
MDCTIDVILIRKVRPPAAYLNRRCSLGALSTLCPSQGFLGEQPVARDINPYAPTIKTEWTTNLHRR